MNQAHLPSIDRVGVACFDELEALVAAGQDITPELLNSFNLLFGAKTFGKALEVVDGGGITAFKGEASGRVVYQVQGRRSGDSYVVFPSHYCSCHMFQYDVVAKAEAVCCKHQLAVRLAAAMKQAMVIPVEDVKLAHILIKHCS